MNKAQLIVFSAIGLLVIAALLLFIGVLPGLKERPSPPFTLVLWGSEDEAVIWNELAERYRQELPSATIAYVKKGKARYEIELLDALAAGAGPDLFIIADEALGRFGNKIQPLPDGRAGYQRAKLKSMFADGVAAAITDTSGALLGTPLDVDTLALFYNRDLFNAANIPHPPRTWEELADDASRLTRRSAVGGIERAGVALGTAANVEHAADILTALIYQGGGNLIDQAGKRSALNAPASAAALDFYTSFANPAKKTYAWNSFFGPALRSFAAGEVAMTFGYAADVPAVVSANPQLNFDTAPLPQPAGASSAFPVGRFHLLVVARTSRQTDQAWKFLGWLQGRDVAKFYADAVGLPPALRDLAASKPPREYLAPFYDAVLSARMLPSIERGSPRTVLNGMIEAVAIRRASIAQALLQAESDLNALLQPIP